MAGKNKWPKCPKCGKNHKVHCTSARVRTARPSRKRSAGLDLMGFIKAAGIPGIESEAEASRVIEEFNDAFHGGFLGSRGSLYMLDGTVYFDYGIVEIEGQVFPVKPGLEQDAAVLWAATLGEKRRPTKLRNPAGYTPGGRKPARTKGGRFAKGCKTGRTRNPSHLHTLAKKAPAKVLKQIAAARASVKPVYHDHDEKYDAAFEKHTGLSAKEVAGRPQTDPVRAAYYDAAIEIEDAYEDACPNVHYHGATRAEWDADIALMKAGKWPSNTHWWGHDRCDDAEQAAAVILKTLKGMPGMTIVDTHTFGGTTGGMEVLCHIPGEEYLQIVESRYEPMKKALARFKAGK